MLVLKYDALDLPAAGAPGAQLEADDNEELEGKAAAPIASTPTSRRRPSPLTTCSCWSTSTTRATFPPRARPARSSRRTTTRSSRARRPRPSPAGRSRRAGRTSPRPSPAGRWAPPGPGPPRASHRAPPAPQPPPPSPPRPTAPPPPSPGRERVTARSPRARRGTGVTECLCCCVGTWGAEITTSSFALFSLRLNPATGCFARCAHISGVTGDTLILV